MRPQNAPTASTTRLRLFFVSIHADFERNRSALGAHTPFSLQFCFFLFLHSIITRVPGVRFVRMDACPYV